MFKISNLILGGRSIIVLVVLFLTFNSLMKNTIPPEVVLDLKFGYSAKAAYLTLADMGVEMRQAYIKCLLIFDIPYMVIYTLLFIQLLNFLWKDTRIQLFSIGILIFDFFENLAIYIMIQIFPDYSSFMGFSASFFTSSKWILVSIVITLSIVGAVKKIFSNQRQGLL
jgi:hypothetical protein